MEKKPDTNIALLLQKINFLQSQIDFSVVDKNSIDFQLLKKYIIQLNNFVDADPSTSEIKNANSFLNDSIQFQFENQKIINELYLNETSKNEVFAKQIPQTNKNTIFSKSTHNVAIFDSIDKYEELTFGVKPQEEQKVTKPHFKTIAEKYLKESVVEEIEEEEYYDDNSENVVEEPKQEDNQSNIIDFSYDPENEIQEEEMISQRNIKSTTDPDKKKVNELDAEKDSIIDRIIEEKKVFDAKLQSGIKSFNLSRLFSFNKNKDKETKRSVEIENNYSEKIIDQNIVENNVKPTINDLYSKNKESNEDVADEEPVQTIPEENDLVLQIKQESEIFEEEIIDAKESSITKNEIIEESEDNMVLLTDKADDLNIESEEFDFSLIEPNKEEPAIFEKEVEVQPTDESKKDGIINSINEIDLPLKESSASELQNIQSEAELTPETDLSEDKVTGINAPVTKDEPENKLINETEAEAEQINELKESEIKVSEDLNESEDNEVDVITDENDYSTGSVKVLQEEIKDEQTEGSKDIEEVTPVLQNEVKDQKQQTNEELIKIERDKLITLINAVKENIDTREEEEKTNISGQFDLFNNPFVNEKKKEVALNEQETISGSLFDQTESNKNEVTEAIIDKSDVKTEPDEIESFESVGKVENLNLKVDPVKLDLNIVGGEESEASDAEEIKAEKSFYSDIKESDFEALKDFAAISQMEEIVPLPEELVIKNEEGSNQEIEDNISEPKENAEKKNSLSVDEINAIIFSVSEKDENDFHQVNYHKNNDEVKIAEDSSADSPVAEMIVEEKPEAEAKKVTEEISEISSDELSKETKPEDVVKEDLPENKDGSEEILSDKPEIINSDDYVTAEKGSISELTDITTEERSEAEAIKINEEISEISSDELSKETIQEDAAKEDLTENTEENKDGSEEILSDKPEIINSDDDVTSEKGSISELTADITEKRSEAEGLKVTEEISEIKSDELSKETKPEDVAKEDLPENKDGSEEILSDKSEIINSDDDVTAEKGSFIDLTDNITEKENKGLPVEEQKDEVINESEKEEESKAIIAKEQSETITIDISEEDPVEDVAKEEEPLETEKQDIVINEEVKEDKPDEQKEMINVDQVTDPITAEKGSEEFTDEQSEVIKSEKQAEEIIPAKTDIKEDPEIITLGNVFDEEPESEEEVNSMVLESAFEEIIDQKEQDEVETMIEDENSSIEKVDGSLSLFDRYENALNSQINLMFEGEDKGKKESKSKKKASAGSKRSGSKKVTVKKNKKEEINESDDTKKKTGKPKGKKVKPKVDKTIKSNTKAKTGSKSKTAKKKKIKAESNLEKEKENKVNEEVEKLDHNIEIDDYLSNAGGKKDFRRLINVNDRFSFIQSLFDGSYVKFENTITQINNIKELDTAKKYVSQSLVKKYFWDVENNTYKYFMKLIEKNYDDGIDPK